jgi:hypothetical protein
MPSAQTSRDPALKPFPVLVPASVDQNGMT